MQKQIKQTKQEYIQSTTNNERQYRKGVITFTEYVKLDSDALERFKDRLVDIVIQDF